MTFPEHKRGRFISRGKKGIVKACLHFYIIVSCTTTRNGMLSYKILVGQVRLQGKESGSKSRMINPNKAFFNPFSAKTKVYLRMLEICLSLNDTKRWKKFVLLFLSNQVSEEITARYSSFATCFLSSFH